MTSLQARNVGASAEIGETNHAGVQGGRSVWWSWTAPAGDMVNFTTSGSTFDTLLAVYTGMALTNLTWVASDNDTADGLASTVTFAVLALGTLALISGLRRHYPKHCSFLGYTRFSNYFMIMIFPMQAHFLSWSWQRVAVIALFALPVWLVLHFGLMPLRK